MGRNGPPWSTQGTWEHPGGRSHRTVVALRSLAPQFEGQEKPGWLQPSSLSLAGKVGTPFHSPFIPQALPGRPRSYPPLPGLPARGFCHVLLPSCPALLRRALGSEGPRSGGDPASGGSFAPSGVKASGKCLGGIQRTIHGPRPCLGERTVTSCGQVGFSPEGGSSQGDWLPYSFSAERPVVLPRGLL